VTCRLLNPQDRDRSPVLVSFSDITAQRVITQRLAHQAAHDALTGLPNRAHIVETMRALQRGAGGLTAVLFIDLDDLKTVNDTRGHDAGDAVSGHSPTGCAWPSERTTSLADSPATSSSYY
jgi:predicted signal transduction protein with EAL and GGDEF domain